MNVRRLIVALLALAIAPLAYAEGGSVIDEMAIARDLALTHIGDAANAEGFDVMSAMLEPMEFLSVEGAGKVHHQAWYDADGVYKQVYRGIVGVAVPSKVPGFETLKSAMNADVSIILSTNGVPYAECMLAAEPGTSLTFVMFELDLRAKYSDVRPNRGICDIDVLKTGTQIGIPQMQYKDALTVVVKGKPYATYEFLKGYCQ
ncbi:MAG: hypothetical protein OEQ74_00815 [Gammaproteobacteria bacterium]|nr:hypothetical protein [Gammaproteobacteria bacterium]